MAIMVEKRDREAISGDLQMPPMVASYGLSVFRRDHDPEGVDRIERTKHLPAQIMEAYVLIALRDATMKKLDDGAFFFEIKGFPGVWASSDDIRQGVFELADVLRDWLIMKIEQNDRDIPVMGVINLNVL